MSDHPPAALDPYAPPRSNTATASGGGAEGGEAMTDDEIAAFVGENAAYWNAKWFDANRTGGWWSGFNWAAGFLSYGWTLYRRMYLEFAIMNVAAFATIVALYVVMGTEALDGDTRLFELGINLMFGIAMGFAGNALYLRKARAAVRAARAEEPDPERRRARLARKGGTSGIAVAIGLMARVLVSIVSR